MQEPPAKSTNNLAPSLAITVDAICNKISSELFPPATSLHLAQSQASVVLALLRYCRLPTRRNPTGPKDNTHFR
jgi:hypothetical protein